MWVRRWVVTQSYPSYFCRQESSFKRLRKVGGGGELKAGIIMKYFIQRVQGSEVGWNERESPRMQERLNASR